MMLFCMRYLSPVFGSTPPWNMPADCQAEVTPSHIVTTIALLILTASAFLALSNFFDTEYSQFFLYVHLHI